MMGIFEYQEGTYAASVTCTNCGHRATIQIQKGVQIGTQPCSNCGCKTLMKTGF